MGAHGRRFAEAGAGAGPDGPEMEPMRRLGERLRALRSEAGLSVTEVAGLAGLSIGTVSRIERNGLTPSLASLRALAQVFGVPISDLFRPTGDQPACSLVRAEETCPNSNETRRALNRPFEGPVPFEAFLVSAGPQAPQRMTADRGIGLIYMLEGAMTYELDGRAYALAPGDTLMWSAFDAHGPRQTSQGGARYISIALRPRRGAC